MNSQITKHIKHLKINTLLLDILTLEAYLNLQTQNNELANGMHKFLK